MEIDDKLKEIDEKHYQLKDKHIHLLWRVTTLEDKTKTLETLHNSILDKLDALTKQIQQMHVDRLIDNDREQRGKLLRGAASTIMQFLANLAAVYVVVKTLTP